MAGLHVPGCRGKWRAQQCDYVILKEPRFARRLEGWPRAHIHRRVTSGNRHCEERSDEAIQFLLCGLWIASLRSQ
jgi:hypothetical protein